MQEKEGQKAAIREPKEDKLFSFIVHEAKIICFESGKFLLTRIILILLMLVLFLLSIASVSALLEMIGLLK